MNNQHKGSTSWPYLGYAPAYPLTMREPSPKEQSPAMEPLQPNPNKREPKPRSRRKAPARRMQTTRRSGNGPSKSTLRANARQQPRDQEGKFAEKGGWFKGAWDAWLDPTPKAPTKLNKKQPREQRSFSETRNINRTGPTRSRRKKPVPERGFFGRIGAVFNGDYARWNRQQARKQATMQADLYGYPKKRTKRLPRRSKRRPAPPPPRRSLFGFLPF